MFIVCPVTNEELLDISHIKHSSISLGVPIFFNGFMLETISLALSLEIILSESLVSINPGAMQLNL